MKLLSETKCTLLFKDNKELCSRINLKELKSMETKHSYVNKGRRNLSYMQIVWQSREEVF